jgi:1-acyl-sn-glycerol-3-phosphate acyltransferase
VACCYYVAREIARILLLLLTNRRVRGRDNVPERGPLLIAANHLHLADPPVLSSSLSRRVTFMAKEELFRPRFAGYLLRKLGAFPVKKRQLNRGAFQWADQLLAQGLALAAFPEGRRSKDAQLQPAFSGMALIASRSGVPVLPIGITGTENIRGMVWFFHRPRVTVNIGRPFHLPPLSDRLTKVELTELTDTMMERIAELLPKKYRGNYTGKIKKKA